VKSFAEQFNKPEDVFVTIKLDPDVGQFVSEFTDRWFKENMSIDIIAMSLEIPKKLLGA
jgi:hypothetical protein